MGKQVCIYESVSKSNQQSRSYLGEWIERWTAMKVGTCTFFRTFYPATVWAVYCLPDKLERSQIGQFLFCKI